MLFKKRPLPPPGRHVKVPQTGKDMRPNAVFSYHANRSIRQTNLYRDSGHEQKLDIPRHQKHFKIMQKLPVVTSIVVIILVSALLLRINGNNPKVESVQLSGGQLFLRDQSVYQQAATHAFDNWLNRNKLTINTEKINTSLKQQFPELHVVSVSLPVFGARPTVFIQPAIPRLLLVAKNGMYVLDSNGRALIAGNQVAKLTELSVPVVSDESDIAIQAGAIALPKATVGFINEVTGQLQAKDIKITSLTLPAGANELHVRIEGEKYFVKFNLHANAREEVGAFIAVRQQLMREKKHPQAYIDVRVENRVFYK